MHRRIAILGSTGSIGESTLRVIADNPERFTVVALAGGRNWKRLAEQVRQFSPPLVSVSDPGEALRLRSEVPNGTSVLSGEEGLREVAAGMGADIVVSALVGAAGLSPTLDAIESGSDVALANKEVLVMAGELVTNRARKKGAAILPVDSEHAAVKQALAGRSANELNRIVLTASGGPFRTFAHDRLEKVSPREALRHPNWKMGPKISVDSATMMNKGLELIEARWLFGLESARLDVIVHPQSIIHALIEFVDGTFLAQMSVPDMRLPIAQALSHPERITNQVPGLDLAHIGNLTFEEPDTVRFPCLVHAKKALRAEGIAPAVLNAANEMAVTSFLDGGAGFMDIPAIVGETLEAHTEKSADDLDSVIEADRWAREFAAGLLNGRRVEARV